MYTSIISLRISYIACVVFLRALFLGLLCFWFSLRIYQLPILLDCMVWLFDNESKLLFSNLIFHDYRWQFYSWNLVIGMIVNSGKNKSIHFTGTAQITFPPDLLLENVNSHEDFGVCVGYDLKLNHHVTAKLQKARQSFFALESKVPFNTRPLLSFICTTVWCYKFCFMVSQLGIPS